MSYSANCLGRVLDLPSIALRHKIFGSRPLHTTTVFVPAGGTDHKLFLVCHWLCQCVLEPRGSPLLNQLMVQERPGKQCFRFWQEGGGFDRNLFSTAAIAASIDYIHLNPVKRGLCKQAIQFKWSSARFHLQNITDANLPELTRPDPEWFHGSGVQSDHA